MNTEAIVSSGQKLLYNADTLIRTRAGHACPVMMHVCLTNACQLKCPFCCYADRPEGILPINKLLKFADACRELGCTTWELTGGGEPLLHPKVNLLLWTLRLYGFSVGIMTNGLALDRLDDPAFPRWIRVSLHAIEQGLGPRLAKRIARVREATRVSGCFVATEENFHLLPEVIAFARDNNLPVKVEPNCFASPGVVLALVERLKPALAGQDHVFLDFSTTLEQHAGPCYLHVIKPFLYTDGWLCDCPLPVGPARTIDPEFRLCRMENVLDYYRGLTAKTLARSHACAFCRYADHNDVANAILNPLPDKEFC
ncbi:MAG: radical SAM protein [Planctomycetaceae bacterium]